MSTLTILALAIAAIIILKSSKKTRRQFTLAVLLLAMLYVASQFVNINLTISF